MILAGVALAAAPPPVANGEESEEWEAVGALYAYSEASDGVEVCTGTLVEASTVLTAAHCVEPLTDYANGGFRVYFLQGGSVDTFTSFSEMASATEHPDWNETRVRWDIGVVALRTPAAATPMALTTETMDASWIGTKVTVVGWGNVDLDENGSGTKRVGETTISSVATDQFTVSASPDGAASCPGDSGGAVISPAEEVVGVVSWGTLDASAAYPCGTQQGDARVDVAAEWITAQFPSVADTGAGPETGATTDTGTQPHDSGTEPQESGKIQQTAANKLAPGGCGCQTDGGSAAWTGLLALFARRRSVGGRQGHVEPGSVVARVFPQHVRPEGDGPG